MRRRGSIISQLLIAFSVFAVLMVVAAVVGYVAVAGQNATARQLTGRDYVLQQTAGHMQEEFNTGQIATGSYALSGRPVFLRLIPGERALFIRNAARLRALAPARLQYYVTGQAQAGAQLFGIASRISRLPPSSPAARGLAAGIGLAARKFYLANRGFQDSMAVEVRRLTSESKDSLSTALAWSAAALAVAVVLVLAGSLSTLRTITRPLQALTGVVRRLTAGDHAARATAAGSAEVREVARAVNAQADEADRLRAREAESNRLRAIAREAGLRIREPLIARDVIAAARAALEEHAGADFVYVRLLQPEQLGVPPAQLVQLAGADVLRHRLARSFLTELDSLFRAQGSTIIHDLGGPEGEQLPRHVLDELRQAGAGSMLITPFGVGTELLGVVGLHRRADGRPWSRAEIDMVESIAADLGRGLHHAQLYETENRLVSELRALEAARSDFFATVSHELRAPLTSIEGYVEILRDGEAGPVSSEQRKMLTTVDRSTGRLRSLIEDVFTLSKLESGTLPTVTRPVNLTEVITGALDAVQPSVSAGGLTVAVDAPAAGLVVDGDSGQLDRVLINLLSNAVKFTPSGGHVGVTAAAADGEAVVQVTDTGIGIPARDLQQIFSRFYRASNAREREIPGTGLGLVIVRTIIAGHHGEVTLDSREGQGTTVTVRLPLAGQAAALPGLPRYPGSTVTWAALLPGSTVTRAALLPRQHRCQAAPLPRPAAAPAGRWRPPGHPPAAGR